MAYNLKSEEEVKEYIKNLGTEYRFGCYSEKNPEVCHLLGDFLEAVKQDFRKAAKVYKANCDDRNYAKSCYKYGTYVGLGKGEEKRDNKVAMEYFHKGCNLNQPEACFYEGMMLIAGVEDNTFNKDPKRGISLMEKSCLGKFANACFYTSGVYISGVKECQSSNTTHNSDNEYIISKNMEKAFKYAIEGCHLGNMYSCANVSQMYTKGEGVQKNDELAQKYKKIALEMEEEMKSNKSLTFQQGL